MPDKPVLTSCGFLIARQQFDLELLIMEHADRLDLPKGHVEPGETQMQCALRELEEETGLRRENIHIVSDFSFKLRYRVHAPWIGEEPVLKELIIFLAWLAEPNRSIIVTEHLGHRWVKYRQNMTLQKKTLDPLLRQLDEFWGTCPPQPRNGGS